MSDSIFRQPTALQLEGFVKGDPIAIDEVVHILLPQLHRWGIQKYSNLPQDEVQSVINRALAEACRNHARYSHQKAKITTYLIGLIDLRMATLHQSIKKKVETETLFSDQQENFPQRVYNSSNTEEIDNRLARDQFFSGVKERLDNVELEVLELMLQGEKSQDEYLLVLQRHQSVTDPAADVKNFKERLKRKVKTIADELGYDKQDLLNE
jgi:hypothetical protein